MCTNWLKKQKVYGTNKKYVKLVSDHVFKGKVVVSNMSFYAHRVKQEKPIS